MSSSSSSSFIFPSTKVMARARNERSRLGSRDDARPRSRSRSASVRSRSRSSTASSFIAHLSHHQHANGLLKHQERIYSLYRLLLLELNLPGATSSRSGGASSDGQLPDGDLSYEQIINMTRIPLALEKFMVFGLLICFNSFLTLFTLVPLKIVIMISRTFSLPKTSPVNFNAVLHHLHCVKRDIITVSLIFVSVCILLTPNLDISRMYHDVRGQAQIRLYVMFGVLEVGDKLCSSIGQDILNILYNIPVLLHRGNWAKLAIFYVLAVSYLSFHSYICIYQTVSLNVAANSYSNALLALLLSNQFAELKSSVFKKFEREGLFQITMSDLTERFQLSLMLSIIALRNLLQLSTNHIGLIPNSWKSWNKWIGAIFGPGIVVLGSEIFVDWLKHCYITKFNRVRPRIYLNFLYVLSLDFLEVVKSSPNANLLHDLTDYIVLTKRIGLPLLALTVCFLRMTLPDLKSLFIIPHSSLIYSFFVSLALLLLTFATLLFIRLILGIVILKWANKIRQQHQTYQTNLKKAQTDPVLTSTVFGANLPNLSPIKRESSSLKPSVPPILTSGLSLLDLSATGSHMSIRSRTPSPIDPLHILGEDVFDIKEATNEHETRKPATNEPDTNNELDTNDKSDTNYKPDTNNESQANTKDETDNELSESYIQSPIELSFLPGVPNTEASTINPTTRSYLYDYGEKIPPTVEEKRNKTFLNTHGHQRTHSEDEGLGKVMRYEMSSKRIW